MLRAFDFIRPAVNRGGGGLFSRQLPPDQWQLERSNLFNISMVLMQITPTSYAAPPEISLAYVEDIINGKPARLREYAKWIKYTESPFPCGAVPKLEAQGIGPWEVDEDDGEIPWVMLTAGGMDPLMKADSETPVPDNEGAAPLAGNHGGTEARKTIPSRVSTISDTQGG
ncbi:hypothetical protein MCOR25_002181 [Pyricularia grisea]|nr:hypothetical protein MCOR25_002181 [Pyricularia grisea]